MLGSTSLIGGHGTTIAWAPIITNRFGLTNALEVGIASATLGLVIASLISGPIAQFLITRYRLSGRKDAELTMGVSREEIAAHQPAASCNELALVCDVCRGGD